MSYKDVLVFLDPFIETESRVKLAAEIARANQARLIGVDVSTRAALEGAFHFAAGTLEHRFGEIAQQAGVKFDFRVAEERSKSWKDFYAHYADLVVASQHNPEAPSRLSADIVEPVLLSAGVPMLIVPPEWDYAPIGQKIAIAWNASREATRAVHDAMPLLTAAKSVVLFELEPPSDVKDSAPNLMASHLTQHGVSVEVEAWASDGDSSPVDALFALLDRHAIDLIVAGAYGHSRFMESLFGGVSRDLLRQPSLPVLMSH